MRGSSTCARECRWRMERSGVLQQSVACCGGEVEWGGASVNGTGTVNGTRRKCLGGPVGEVQRGVGRDAAHDGHGEPEHLADLVQHERLPAHAHQHTLEPLAPPAAAARRVRRRRERAHYSRLVHL